MPLDNTTPESSCQGCIHADTLDPKGAVDLSQTRPVYCFRYPPQAHIVPTQNQMDPNQMDINPIFLFPAAMHRCGEYRSNDK